jgi:hypothetical protein
MNMNQKKQKNQLLAIATAILYSILYITAPHPPKELWAVGIPALLVTWIVRVCELRA